MDNNYTSWGLPPWHKIIEPHTDVANGTYKKAEFAADLAQVVRGEAGNEYQYPEEFFARTYITEGIKQTLVKTLQRLAGRGGDPVIQMQTAFGGGKTHTMLALYHFMGAANPEKLPHVKEIFDKAGLAERPHVTIAVIVGTDLNPAKPREEKALGGIQVHTLWGELAAQLACKTGRPELFERLRVNDEQGIAPGVGELRELLDECGPCMILIDELVDYVRRLFGKNDLPSGNFENILSFVQELTEAAKASRNSIVIASLPASEIESGLEAGSKVLHALEHTFERLESVWQPVSHEEGFEIVRRRLFKDINENKKDELRKVCNAYFNMYHDNKMFPPEAREPDYLGKLMKCYPLHPEIFERLYSDWATLGHFQRTRGVLRFIAALTFKLYCLNDSNPLIMPGDIRFDDSDVNAELMHALEASSLAWQPVLNKEVDGKGSKPEQLDIANPHMQKPFARVTRTLFLGSAPNSGSATGRGLDEAHILLGAVRVGDTISNYNTALTTLGKDLAYLYNSTNKFWFDTKATLQKMAAELAAKKSDEENFNKIKALLKDKLRGQTNLVSVQVCPTDTGDVREDNKVHLVVLPPQYTVPDTAKDQAWNFVNKFGNASRLQRNMVLFLAGNSIAMESMKEDASYVLAWQELMNDADALRLDSGQQKQVKNKLDQAIKTLDDKVPTVYTHLLVPASDSANKDTMKSYSWREGPGTNATKNALNKLLEESLISSGLTGKHLYDDLKQYVFDMGKNHIGVEELWKMYMQYLFMYRLTGPQVLYRAIQEGVKEGLFEYAESATENGEYDGIKRKGQFIHLQEPKGYVVKLGVVPAEEPPEEPKPDPDQSKSPHDKNTESQGGGGTKTPKQDTQFDLFESLDYTTLSNYVSRIKTEIIELFKDLPGVNITTNLEVKVTWDRGIPKDLADKVRENCMQMGINSGRFS